MRNIVLVLINFVFVYLAYVTAYIVVVLVAFGAAISGTVWAVFIFVKRFVYPLLKTPKYFFYNCFVFTCLLAWMFVVVFFVWFFSVICLCEYFLFVCSFLSDSLAMWPLVCCFLLLLFFCLFFLLVRYLNFVSFQVVSVFYAIFFFQSISFLLFLCCFLFLVSSYNLSEFLTLRSQIPGNDRQIRKINKWRRRRRSCGINHIFTNSKYTYFNKVSRQKPTKLGPGRIIAIQYSLPAF